MKLLFDENLSPKLPNRLSDIFPNSLHVRDVGMKSTIDPVVWDYAFIQQFDDCLERRGYARSELSIWESTESYLASRWKLFDIAS
ncbi:DUF5615 family PIN-like protein [Tychonema sp. LEGE 07203]|uniref:DUF5615 family PIN-like protein n=1 Tax=Tychonema sp. LEGE 07203 TaxID=1828671 RepID=UPI0021042A71|nr:DUF5615 family PIN-like protein [Tychonema sp. LEGE 07203]